MQDVHLVFLDLRWSCCVTFVFSLLTTSSCLLFLLGGREGEFTICSCIYHSLIQITLWPSLVFHKKKEQTSFGSAHTQVRTSPFSPPEGIKSQSLNLFLYSPLPATYCCIRFHLDIILINLLLLLLCISIASPYLQHFMVTLQKSPTTGNGKAINHHLIQVQSALVRWLIKTKSSNFSGWFSPRLTGNFLVQRKISFSVWKKKPLFRQEISKSSVKAFLAPSRWGLICIRLLAIPTLLWFEHIIN